MDLFRASSRVTALRLGSIAAWALVGILTAHVLSVSERGVYAAAVLIAELGASLAGSFSAGCIRRIANGDGSPPTILRTGLKLSVAIGVGMFAVAAVVWLAWRDGPGVPVLLVGALFLPVMLRAMFAGALVATGAVGRAQLAGISGVLSGLLLIGLWANLVDDRTATGALVMWTVAQYGSVAVAALLTTGMLFGRGLPMPGLVRYVVTFGSVAGMAGLVGLVQRRIDLLLVAALSGSHGTGLYSAATSLAELQLVVPAAIATAAVAGIGRADDERARRLVALCSRQAVMLGMLAAAGIFVVGPVALRVAFGADYAAAATPLRILALAAIFITPQSMVITYFYVRLGRPGVPLAVISAAAVVEVGMALALVPRMGLNGAATADAAAYIIEALGLTVAMHRYAGVGWRELWLPTFDDIAAYGRGARGVARRRRALAGGQ
jgi:O-antigen/teichoic acid export membrane protein